MEIDLKPGIYLVAVSGGVDSVALLDILAQQPALELTVAHFDHGIRENSAEDRYFVEDLAKKYKLTFVYGEGHLGSKASEAIAREARYKFLRKVKDENGAEAIITAHHQDDLLETAILNMLRGTGRKGLTSLKSQPDLLRPLLKVPKKEILGYAKNKKLNWREDPTNLNTDYLRNHVRHNILPRFSAKDTAKMVNIVTKSTVLNEEIDREMNEALKNQPLQLDRLWFNQLPHDVAREVMAAWLRANETRDFDRQTIERLVTAAKTGKTGKEFPVLKGVKLELGKDFLALNVPER